jgi:hypothetical protein
MPPFDTLKRWDARTLRQTACAVASDSGWNALAPRFCGFINDFEDGLVFALAESTKWKDALGQPDYRQANVQADSRSRRFLPDALKQRLQKALKISTAHLPSKPYELPHATTIPRGLHSGGGGGRDCVDSSASARR